MILDATCSLQRAWPKVAVVRVDISPLARPDVVADCRRLPFADSSFAEVYCDPPFNVYRTGTVRDLKIRSCEKAEYVRFSHFETYREWLDFLKASDLEFSRVLVPSGLLHYKLPHGRRPDGTRNGASISQADLPLAVHFERLHDETHLARGPFAPLAEARGFHRWPTYFVTLRNRKGDP